MKKTSPKSKLTVNKFEIVRNLEKYRYVPDYPLNTFSFPKESSCIIQLEKYLEYYYCIQNGPRIDCKREYCTLR